MSSTARVISLSPGEQADAKVREVLRMQWEGVPATRIDSPPGAGKTGIVERLAVQAMARMGERCMVVSQTNEQAFDLARRMSGRFASQPFVLFVSKGMEVPDDLACRDNLTVVRKEAELPKGPCVAIANSEKWSWWADRAEPFDLQVVDEAFQLPDYRFHQIAGIAKRFVLVGDPGQIGPVITVDTDEWRHDPAGPHVSSPDALMARHPGISRIRLPISRRLVDDSVRILQPVFYRDLPFSAICGHGERGLGIAFPGRGSLDSPIRLASKGASFVQVELPEGGYGEVDGDVADAVSGLVEQLFHSRVWIWDNTRQIRSRPLDDADVGVVCAHVSQVGAVRERLTARHPNVFVETADRFQGLERPVMIAWHPLSGRYDAGIFHLDQGRMCVALSRHSIACFVVGRKGMEEMLRDLPLAGNRTLGISQDSEFEGWNAHVNLLAKLKIGGRRISI